ncbi:gamma subclass chorismate mutase AroQ [Pandoraea terrigena]|uniref:chorismate mutase n=1 Tax=Pandoraea terrigena TaxID=2508292 RepID=A0A5E4YPR5_9BURK|nr:gamma subclass chorismate mutase AroQ [Pandoraea terrigena]VVE50806.1 Monofunctional chorismate mutase [Pandoraea terrigena]
MQSDSNALFARGTRLRRVATGLTATALGLICAGAQASPAAQTSGYDANAGLSSSAPSSATHTLAPAAPHGVRGLAVRLVSQTLATTPRNAADAPHPPKPPAVVDPVLDPLMRGILERLAISEAVARTKYSSGKPVQDTPREQALLDSMGDRAAQYGLTPAQARTFFRLQIEAGKLVQTALLARWKREGGAPGEPVDLATRLRPALDRLGASLMHDLGRLCALPDGPLRMARIHQARERIAKAAKLEALQRAAFDEATSGLCLSAPPRIWTLSVRR